MRRVCAWCDNVMGYTEDEQEGDTHGICQQCLNECFPEEASKFRRDHYENRHEQFCVVAG